MHSGHIPPNLSKLSVQVIKLSILNTSFSLVGVDGGQYTTFTRYVESVICKECTIYVCIVPICMGKIEGQEKCAVLT